MTTQIINAGASLKIINDGVSKFVMKAQIREVDIVRDTIIRLDIGEGALYNVFVNQLEVTVPVSTSVENLRDQILEMLQSSSAAGLATEAKQIEQLAELQNVKTSVNDLKDKVTLAGDKITPAPTIVDETNPNLIYNGFAVLGAPRNEPIWAIQKVTNTNGTLTYQWAGGNKNFDKVWDNRKTLLYS
ncbi:MAG: hypothetical protein ABIP51_00275 [Bacteroidia bacterium]